MRLLSGIFCILAFMNSTIAEEQPAPPTPPPACQSDAHRAFDFWIGSWDVYAKDQLAGTNRIELRHNGCVLHESWVSAAGNFSGNSLNLYDAGRNVWHQSWADSSGLLLQLEGGLVDGKMVLEGSRPGKDGVSITHRISWTPNADGSVRQLWETRTAENEWKVAFDGHYRKAQK